LGKVRFVVAEQSKRDEIVLIEEDAGEYVTVLTKWPR